MLAVAPVEKPTPAGPYRYSTLAIRLQWLVFVLKLVELRTNTNSLLEYSQLCRTEHPGPGDNNTTKGSLEGLFSEGV